MLEITHPELWQKIVAESLQTLNKSALAVNTRWAHAIGAASAEIEASPYLHWEEKTQTLVCASRTGSGSYRLTVGSCECEAGRFGQPCWHRAAARLWSKYLVKLKYERTENLQVGRNSSVTARTEENSFLINQGSRKPLEKLGGMPL